MIGDGYCDDMINIFDCNYDGGDCCDSDIETTFCNLCQCLGTTTSPISNITTTSTSSESTITTISTIDSKA